MIRVLVFLTTLTLVACSKDVPSGKPETTTQLAATDPSKAPKAHKKVTTAEVHALIGKVEVNNAGEGWDDETMRILEPSELTFDALQGPMGPFAEATLFFDNRIGAAFTFTGWVIADVNGKKTAWRLAHDTGALERIRAVDFVDVGKDGATDILVEFEYVTGMGPNGLEPIPSVVVLFWEFGISNFVTRPELLEESSAGTLEEAKTYLRQKGQIN